MHRFIHIEKIKIKDKAFDFERIQECFSGFNKDRDYRDEGYYQQIHLEWMDGYKEVVQQNTIESMLTSTYSHKTENYEEKILHTILHKPKN